MGFVPARSGSKRIPGKNTRVLQGHPLLAYTVAAAVDSDVFDDVILSTDSEEIAAIGQHYGAEVPFLRPKEYAADVSPDELHRDLGNSFKSLYDTLVHIYQADAIWWDRLMGAPTANLDRYAPPPEFADFSKKWLAILDAYIVWGEKQTRAEWDRIAAYHNTKGEPFDSPVWQIVLHVVNHASYHRGQVTTMLRQLGRTPAGTDLIAYYRTL